jgi:hypothetical protein
MSMQVKLVTIWWHDIKQVTNQTPEI